MKGKYSKVILDYCLERGIDVPPGFMRRAASHIAVFKLNESETKLVAKTFFKKEDLKHYISNSLLEQNVFPKGSVLARVVDFKENKEFQVNSDGSLTEL
ncbi:hypothetical protein D8T43_22720 [Vibrio vulnificus]|uniref:hypothetical protein n=1 Tax=Vibrio vulnificus TaxID=672 RepID=UPI00102AA34C|nr:hypothetical protein [Vibrio vulnificus]RZR03051.1 hypothetical protein D8T43_22720 [Vibrio vulnificus]